MWSSMSEHNLSIVNNIRYLLIGVVTPSQSRSETEEHLSELQLLMQTLGTTATENCIVLQKKIEPATFLSRGKVIELQKYIEEADFGGVIFDDDLSPTQLRNLQQIFGVEIRDRTAVILEIFAKHARTKEAKTQIELATLQYLLPRLSHRWGHLERQVGGIGVRAGAGETQIEMDRRVVKDRIAKLQAELVTIDHERQVQSKRRQNCYRIVLVGYTNAGKSTLLNLCANAEVYVADQLFATLDSTVRQWKLNGYPKILLTDTIGFIRKLPPNLIASFRSTLSEIREADLIIIVADLSTAQCMRQMETVEEILQTMGVAEKPRIVVFNKIDRVDQPILRLARQVYPEAVFISALKHLRLAEFYQAIQQKIEEAMLTLTVTLPASAGNAIALLYEHATILAEQYRGDQAIFTIRCYRNIWRWLGPTLNQINHPVAISEKAM